ncbi:MAG: methyltransferase domain-containing protein [Rhizobacter sp.]
MSWNPAQYLKFAQPRLRPALDLLARVPLDDPRHVCDLGCGTGSLTRVMAERWPQAQVTGIDSSASMLQQASETPANVHWLQQDMATWAPRQSPDLIYSNAALHWLPDHATLMPRLLSQLSPGGVLAIQMPRNFAAPSHTAITDTVTSGAWRARLEPLLRPTPVATPAWYIDLLASHAAELDVWETEYQQILTGTDPVKEWTKGTWLGSFLAQLDEAEREAFERDYAARVALAYPQRADGTTLFPFRRLFIIARKG